MTAEIERRDFIQRAGLLAAVAATATAVIERPAFAEGASQTGGKGMTYAPKPLSIDPKSINGISEKVLVSHYENNYVGAVKRLNAIGMQLAELDFAKAPNFVVNGLKREELIAANSMILHEIYFDGLGGGATPKNPLVEGIEQRLRQLRALARGIFRDGQGAGRRLRLGDPGLFAARQAARQSMGGRSHDHARRRPAGAGARHVRTRLSHGLRRGGCEVRRCLHGSDPLGQCSEALRPVSNTDLSHLKGTGRGQSEQLLPPYLRHFVGARASPSPRWRQHRLART